MKTKLKYSYLILLLSFLLSFVASDAQWRRLTNLPTPYDKGTYLDIYFLKTNPKFGWTCGFIGNVLRTTDGGDTWQGTRIIVQNSNLQLECIRFADERTGYTSGSGMVFKSTDGGASWFDVTDPRSRDLWGNFFISPDTGMVVGGGCDSPQNFFRTTDGGSSWSLYATNLPNTGLTHVIMESGSGTCFATSSGRIWISTNGGVKWGVMCVSGGDDWQEQISHRGNSFLMPFSGGCTGGDPGGMRMSTDFGKTWKETRVPAAMFGSFLLDSLRGWSVGWEQSAYYTGDGGKTWELKNCGVDPPNTLDDVWFVDDTTAFVVGSGIWKLQGFKRTYPEISVLGDSILCEGDSVTLTSKEEYEFYYWSTGETSRTITVRNAGTYILKTKHTKCDTSFPAVVNIRIHPKPDNRILSDNTFSICEGDSATLSLGSGFVSWDWSTGEKVASITVKKSGTYSVDLVDTNGCKSNSLVNVVVNANPKPEILSKGKPSCVGDSLVLFADKDYAAYYWYIVPDANPFTTGTKQITVNKTGTYVLKVLSPEGCEGMSDSLDIVFREDSNSIYINTSLSSGVLKFDSTLYSDIKCKNLSISNIGWRELTIKNIYIAFNTAYSMPQSQFPIKLQPGETKNLVICFNPMKLGENTDTLILDDNCTPHQVILKGICTSTIYTSISECEVGVIYKTKTIPRKYSASFGTPYPNPASSMLVIPYDIVRDTEASEDYNIDDIKLFNSIGRELSPDGIQIEITREISSTGIKGKVCLNLNGIEPGIYFVSLKIDNNFTQIPVVISD